jgi:PAS domain S-box-containing protein
VNVDIKLFQKRYALANRDMAHVCQCSLPTIQKWRSGEVTPSGSAQQLMRLLDYSAKGDPARLRDLLSAMNRQIDPVGKAPDDDLEEFENSVSKVVNRLELMLESRRKDKELAESEARYRSMVEAQNDPVCRWLPDTTLTYVNSAYADLFSNHGHDLVGRKWIEFVPENRRQAVLTLVSDIVRRGEPEITKHESIGKDGKLQFQQWRDIPILDEKGDVLELHSIGRDQTELMTLRRAFKELDKVNSSLMSLCEQPILIFERDGKFVETNECFRHQILKRNKWTHLEDMFPAMPMKRFKRLLERLSESGQMLYQIQLDGQVTGMRIRVLSEIPGQERYLALFEKSGELSERTVLQTRLSKEVILNGESVPFDLARKAKVALQRQMHTVGTSNHVDRVYVFTFDDETGFFDNILEWCAEGVEGHLDELQRIPQEDYPWWMKRLRKKQWIQVEDTQSLPRTAAHERALLVAQGIRAVLVAPLERNGDVCGFIGFDQNDTRRVWHGQEVEALRQFKESIEAVLAGFIEDALVPAK